MKHRVIKGDESKDSKAVLIRPGDVVLVDEFGCKWIATRYAMVPVSSPRKLSSDLWEFKVYDAS